MEQNRLAVPLVLLVVLLLKKADIFISSSTKLDDRIFVPSSNLNKRENAKENARCLQRSTPWYNTAWHKYSPGQPGLGTLPAQRGWPRRPPETPSKVIHSVIPLRCLSAALLDTCLWSLSRGQGLLLQKKPNFPGRNPRSQPFRDYWSILTEVFALDVIFEHFEMF